VQAGGLIIDSNGFDVSSNAQFGGAGGHIKRGAGSSTMAGNSTYAGTTMVEAGTLLVNGSHTGGGAYTVNAGATLGGTGTIGSAVNVNGAIAPGTSIGTLTTDSVTFGSNGIFDVEIDAAGNSSDLLVVNGNLNLTGLSDMLRLSLAGGTLPESGPLTIATYTGTLTGTFNLDNANFNINYGTGNNSSITISDITSIDPVGGVDGDYNNNGIVDAADYTLWRNSLGDPTEADINFNGDGGGVTEDDYTYWKNRFGNTSGAGAGSAIAVPEPSAIFITVFAAAGLLVGRRRK
jgi:fibronectin-binding autotransporter adhesin